MNETRLAGDLAIYMPEIRSYFWDKSIYIGGDHGWIGAPMPDQGDGIRFSDLGSDGDDLIEIPYTTWGDYVGDTVTRSNCRAILEDYPEHVILVSGGYSSEALVIRTDAQIPVEMFDRIVALREYPLWCEEDHSLLEVELQDEAWDYHAQDLRDAVLEELVGPYGNPSDAEALVEFGEEFYRQYRDAADVLSIYPYCEDAVSAVLFDSDNCRRIARWIANSIEEDFRQIWHCDGQLSFEDVTV